MQRVAVGHARGRLVVRLTLRAGLPSSYWQVSEQVVTGRARFALNVYRGHGWGAVSLYRYRGVQDVRAVRCAGLRVSHGVRTVVLSLPTRCLGEPRSVRVRALVATGDEDGLDVADDALRGGWREGGTRLSPPIPRG